MKQSAKYKDCSHCGQAFIYVKKSKKFCTQKCADAYRYVPHPRIIRGKFKKCDRQDCHEQVWWYPRHLEKFSKRYCNEKCLAIAMRKGAYYPCSECGKQFYLNPYKSKVSNQRTCSVKCGGLRVRRLAEERNTKKPPSKGILNRRLRYSTKMKEWRKAVFVRDNYTCQLCGARNGNGKAIYLEADHIKPFAYFPELRFEIDNGRTLCKPCHKTTDTYGRNVIKIYDTAIV